jgi:hypothetical protein
MLSDKRAMAPANTSTGAEKALKDKELKKIDKEMAVQKGGGQNTAQPAQQGELSEEEMEISEEKEKVQAGAAKKQAKVQKQRDKAQTLKSIPTVYTEVIGEVEERRADEKGQKIDAKESKKMGELDSEIADAQKDAAKAKAEARDAEGAAGSGGQPAPATGGGPGPAGNTGFAQKMMAGGGPGGGGAAPAISVIAFVITIIISIFLYIGQGASSLKLIIPFIIGMMGIVMLIKEGFYSIPGWGMICGVGAYLVYRAAGLSGWPAILPFALWIVGVYLYEQSKQSGHATRWQLPAIVVFIGAGLLFLTQTSAYAMDGLTAIQTGSAQKDIAQAAQSTQKGFAETLKNTIASYEQRVAIATGQHVKGNVEKVKEDVGIEILDPWLPNPKVVREKEIIMDKTYTEAIPKEYGSTVSIGARVKGFDSKTPIHIGAACHYQTMSDASRIRLTKGPNMNPGKALFITPRNASGMAFEESFSCFIPSLGPNSYYVTLSAQADHLRTDGQLRNFVMDNAVLQQEILNELKSKETQLKSDTAVFAAMKKMHPEVVDPISVSQKGAIKVAMATQQIPIIPIDPKKTTQLKFMAAIENVRKGWVMGVNKVEITLPPVFEPKPGYCTGWEYKDGKIKLSSQYLKNADFKSKSKGQQKVLPACFLVLKQVSLDLDQPKEINFLAMVDYNYIVQKQYQLEVQDEKGSSKPRTSSTALASTSSGGGTTTKASTKKATWTTSGGAAWFQATVDACKGKSAGQRCGKDSKGFCTSFSGTLSCSPQCVYYALAGEQGLDTKYDCVAPASDCGSGTTKSFSCNTEFDKETDFACCIPKEKMPASPIVIA